MERGLGLMQEGLRQIIDESVQKIVKERVHQKGFLGDALFVSSEKVKQDGKPDNGEPARFGAGDIVCIDTELTMAGAKDPTKYKVIDTKVQGGVRLYALELQTGERGITTYKVVIDDITLPYPKFKVGTQLRIYTNVGDTGYITPEQIKRLEYDNHLGRWQYWTMCMTSGNSTVPRSEEFLCDYSTDK